MSSMFRRPGDDSSSDSEDAGDRDITSAPDNLDLLSKLHAIKSTDAIHRSQQPATRPPMSRNNSELRDLLLHSLLEEKALREAATRLGKDASASEVQELARLSYHSLAEQLSGVGDVDERYSSESMRSYREAAQKGIKEAIARTHVSTSAPQAVGDSRALVSRAGSSIIFPHLDSLLQIPSPAVHFPLQGYPGLHADRYLKEFVELETIGKGGYGKVYKVRHKLDDGFYAVKRIMVSPARLRRIQEHGPQELESMLEEVRALARFDHCNIVRYHNCWLEYTTLSNDIPPRTVIRSDRLLENAFDSASVNDFQSDIDGLSLGDPFGTQDVDIGDGIVFENSNATVGDSNGGGVYGKSQNQTPERRRRTSKATISSSRSHKSVIESTGEDDDEVEMIPRTHEPYSQLSSGDISESLMVSQSDAPHLLASARYSGPVLTLNVQMSLYENDLAAFLAGTSDPCHCFHECVSLELLAQIVAGVEYLHTQGVVHRDLKPANVFLSITSSAISPFGSVDLSTCQSCPPRDTVHVTPRIGDFGLVAALGDGCTTAEFVKPVGTEFYRPEAGNISEKLDVYALGIVGFEMLQRFSTRMERVDALTRLRKGDSLNGLEFESKTSCRALIAAMTHPEDEKRCSCDEVKKRIKNIVATMKTSVEI